MDGNNVLNFTRLSEGAGFRGAAAEKDQSEIAFDILRSKGFALVVALLVSLGLWGVIWLAVASFVSRVAG
jgi:hypothetical protein